MSLSENKQIIEDDDDDLESLRLAALKSLSQKKESIKSSSPIKKGNAIEVVETLPITTVFSVRNINFNNFNVHNPLDINEPYIPQKISNSTWETQHTYVPYNVNIVPTKPNIIPALSPRSLAFVEENNDILKRRKGEKSPRSPSPYRSESMRWSESPPPSIVNKRSPTYRRSPPRRSISRSPISPKRFNRSPTRTRDHTKQRSISRSPTNIKYKHSKSKSPRKYSPPISNSQTRRKSLSPHTRSNKWNNYDRSPARRSRYNKSSRSPSPKNNRKSQSPFSTANRLNRKRSRSPQKNANPKRSRTRSPYKKNDKQRDRGNNYNKKVFNSKKNNRNNYINNRGYNQNSTIRNDKSDKIRNRHQSPHQNKKERSKSRSPNSSTQTQSTKNDLNQTKLSPVVEEKINEMDKIKSEQEIEDELLASTDEEKDSTDDEMCGGDEIDLFASEESESENEGRFKSSSKSESKSTTSTTVPFSRLGSSSITHIGELKEINSNTGRNSDRSNRNNRDRENKYERSSRNDEWRSSKSSRDRLKESDSNRKNDKKSDSPFSSGNSKMFKSTFKAVEIQDTKSSKNILSSNLKKYDDEKLGNKIISSEVSLEKKHVIQLKRPTSLKDNKDDEDRNGTADSTHLDDEDKNSTKKPIHLRLGAIAGQSRSQNIKTGTNWKNKKTWRSEKV